MTPARQRPALLALVALLAASVLAGCTGSEEPSPGADTDLPPPPPEVGECYRLQVADVTATSSDAEPVTCSSRHTAVTVHVGRLPGELEDQVDPASQEARRRMEKTCPRRMAGYVGGGTEAQRLSRFQAVWFPPTEEEIVEGARWFRCDVVALRTDKKLQPLPPPGQLRGILKSDAALETFGLCGTAPPGAKNFRRVACAAGHSWVAVSTIDLQGGKKYPGTKKVRQAGDGPCAKQVRAQSGQSLKFEYGWEWPTKQQWRSGQRYGYCWAEQG